MNVTPVDGFPNYVVSERGEVFKKLKGNCNTKGYILLHMRFGPKKRIALLHRVIAEVFLGVPSGPKQVVRHLDGNKHNNAAENLAWGTQRENCQDTIAHGRTTRGVKSPRAKLTNEQVLKIRELLSHGDSHSKIAHEFKVARRTVTAIANKENWSWLP